MGKRDRPMRSKRREGGWRSKRPQDLLKKIRDVEERESRLSRMYWEVTKELAQLQRSFCALEKQSVQDRETRIRMYQDAIHVLACCVEACRVATENVQPPGSHLSLQEMYVRQKDALQKIQEAIAELDDARLMKISDHI